MDFFLLIIGSVAITALLIVAMPELLTTPGQSANKKKKVGPTYWGVYPGSLTKEPDSFRTIELKAKNGKELVVAGSKMYASGKFIKIAD